MLSGLDEEAQIECGDRGPAASGRRYVFHMSLGEEEGHMAAGGVAQGLSPELAAEARHGHGRQGQGRWPIRRRRPRPASRKRHPAPTAQRRRALEC